MILETVKLGEVLEYEQPTKYIVDNENYNNDFPIPVLTAGKSFILGYTNEKTGVFTDVPVIIFDDFTTAIKFVDFPFKVKSSAMKILKANESKADIKFLYYKMQTLKLNSSEHKRYWISKYSQIPISLPTLEKQRKIASILDVADELRQNDKALLAKYNELTQALFLEMFGDNLNNKGNYIEINKISKFIDYRGKTPKKVSSGVPFISAKCVRTGFFDEKRLDFITEETYDKIMTRGYPKIGDVLFTTEGATMGFTCRIPQGMEKFGIGQRLITLQTYSNYNPYVLEFMLNSKEIQDMIFSLATGSAVKGIRSAKFAKIKIPHPKIELQNQFAERVAVIEEQKAIAKKSLEKSEELLNSLLQKAFKGELV